VIILGIDPGSRKAGWGVIEVSGRKLLPVECGVIRLPVKRALLHRLGVLHEELTRIVETFRPDEAVVEGIFQQGAVRNYKSILTLGHARGVALLVLAQAGLPVEEYPPAVIKKSLMGHGRGRKWQIQEMVRALLGLSSVPAEDAADALAAAICHGIRVQNPILRGTR